MVKYLLLFLISAALHAQDLDSSITRLAGSLSARISKAGIKKVSVVDFTDLEGHEIEIGRFIAEQLSVSLVNGDKGFTVLDRANLKIILDEHHLTSTGLFDPSKVRELGKFAGVDAIVRGSITPLGRSLSITSEVISVETTEVVAMATVRFKPSSEVAQNFRDCRTKTGAKCRLFFG